MHSTIQHLGIILDGNRRWAKSRGLPTLKGHQEGYRKIKEIGELCIEKGIKILTVYAFSTENWRRSKEEVGYLMKLLKTAMTEEVGYFKGKNIRVNVIGRTSELPKDLQGAIRNMENATKECKDGVLNIAINYGGRTEIVDAVKKIIKQNTNEDEVTESLIEKNIYTSELPDPDIIIRTSGEQRLSGFLTWQSSYSELYFTKVNWPDFSQKNLDDAINWFSQRSRSFGGNKK